MNSKVAALAVSCCGEYWLLKLYRYALVLFWAPVKSSLITLSSPRWCSRAGEATPPRAPESLEGVCAKDYGSYVNESSLGVAFFIKRIDKIISFFKTLSIPNRLEEERFNIIEFCLKWFQLFTKDSTFSADLSNILFKVCVEYLVHFIFFRLNFYIRSHQCFSYAHFISWIYCVSDGSRRAL
jgi:hypothetical protein